MCQRIPVELEDVEIMIVHPGKISRSVISKDSFVIHEHTTPVGKTKLPIDCSLGAVGRWSDIRPGGGGGF